MKTIRKTLYVSDDGSEWETPEQARRADLKAYMLGLANGCLDLEDFINEILVDPSLHIAHLNKECQRALKFSRR